MSKQSPTISAAPPSDPGMNYGLLREECVKLVQQMSGDIWTDYNFSDPGVTILEQLCYALTELSYRAALPVPDLMGDPNSGRLELGRACLYPARAILPVNPVTIADLRRLLIDRVPGVANAWVTKCPPQPAGGVNGLYEIALLVSEQDPCCRAAGYEPRAVRDKVLAAYGAHRALCEDVQQMRVLDLLATQISAVVHLNETAQSASVLADILFRLGQFLAPEPKQQSLDQLLAAGKTTAEIFDGPLMLHGFIANDQLTPLPQTIAVTDLLRVLAETPGVVAVDQIGVRIEQDAKRYTEADTITVPKNSVLWLNTAPKDRRFSIRLFRGTVECQPDCERVARVLDGLWTLQRQTYPLWSEYAEHYAPPRGRRQDLSLYTSVQDQFPNVYGINAFGLPLNASVKRHGQAKQLKGYLMVFDQMMADYFSQLAFLRELFSLRTGGAQTYAVQSLAPIVPDCEPLLRPTYWNGLLAITAAADPVNARQSAILDLLLSLYAEKLNAPPQAGCDCQSDSDSEAALLAAKRALLARTIPITRDRGRGFDYHRLSLQRNVTGMELRCRIELGVVDATMDGPDNARIVHDPAQTTLGTPLAPQQADAAAGSFLPIGHLLDEAGALGDQPRLPLAGECIADSLAPSLALAEQYRIGILPGETLVAVVCCDTLGQWWLLGRYAGTAAALAAILRLLRTFDDPLQKRQLQIVEHILLRFAAAPGDTDGSYYSFRLSAVIAAEDKELADTTWRQQATAIIRENAPAHVAVDCLFLNHENYKRFLARYRPWLQALRRGDAAKRAETSRRLEHFLKNHPSATSDSSDVPP